jgi:transcriptional regulator with XRE-family HTH domain
VIHPVDEYVGKRLRYRRLLLGLSQEAIGNLTGITFQQVQKYEKGLNRIAISRLYEFAQILNVSIEWFLDGYGIDNLQDNYLTEDRIENAEILALLKAYFSIPLVIRKKVLTLMKAVSLTKQKSYVVL